MRFSAHRLKIIILTLSAWAMVNSYRGNPKLYHAFAKFKLNEGMIVDND